MKKKPIHIKKENRGKFTEYCGGKVTQECITKGKNSLSPAVRKRAIFAQNSRKWKHEYGGDLGVLFLGEGLELLTLLGVCTKQK